MKAMQKTMRKTIVYSLLTIVFLGVTACSNMSTRDKNTAIGAGIGAVGGAVLTGGSALGTVGGAAVGGVIGNQINTKKK
ncbi:glycine zipper 2TM domain-containing protein [Methylotenera sp. G11]|uniref:glycine zipper 2TM domain-containing protein n=1 Tax=Methylotenera sp. G11 TaxID=1506585 RepID=UPI000A61D083|nr:glycine zipper 2TM domain-containing protein [Methylotenera sp. G11]